jgi:hypothetical protein
VFNHIAKFLTITSTPPQPPAPCRTRVLGAPACRFRKDRIHNLRMQASSPLVRTTVHTFHKFHVWINPHVCLLLFHTSSVALLSRDPGLQTLATLLLHDEHTSSCVSSCSVPYSSMTLQVSRIAPALLTCAALQPQFCAAWSTVAAALFVALVGVLLSISSRPPTIRSATPPTSAVRLQDRAGQGDQHQYNSAIDMFTGSGKARCKHQGR